MAVYAMIKYTCPNCHKDSEMKVYDMILASEDQDLKEQIEDLSFFSNTCPDCGTEDTICYPFLYIDDIHHFMVELRNGNESRIDKLLSKASAQKKYQDYIKRETDDPNLFSEKIKILEHGYDDQTIEIMKVMLVLSFREEVKKDPDHILFIWEDNTPSFVFFVDGIPHTKSAFIPDLYKECKEKFADTAAEDLKEERIIDPAWVMKAVRKPLMS